MSDAFQSASLAAARVPGGVPATRPAFERLLWRSAGALSLLAAGLHGTATGQHLREWWLYGLFFILASIAQFVYALLLFALPPEVDWADEASWRAWRRRIYWAGIGGNAAIWILYIVTRTVGIPLLGPEAGRVEPVGPLDVASKATELVLIACLLWLVRQGRSHPSVPA